MKRTRIKKMLTFAVCFVLTAGAAVPSYALQPDHYQDPEETWTMSEERTKELDVNAVVSQETFYCFSCEEERSFTIWRTAEYTKTGMSNLNRDVKFSDGTNFNGTGKNNVDQGIPGKDGYYTGYHWTKSCCETCGTLNANTGDPAYYGHGKNIYLLNDCSSAFSKKLEEKTEFREADDTYHEKTTVTGEYCGLCYGTRKQQNTCLEKHNMEEKIDSQPASFRFAAEYTCRDCGYQEREYFAAKTVVADYYGKADGKPHTVTISDLSDDSVKTSVKYGNSAEKCDLTSAPNYTEEGHYPVYYEITYTLGDASMTENGVAYVGLYDEGSKNSCGCSNPDCGCEDPDCSGDCCKDTCGDRHNFIKLETVEAGCKSLGYDRYLCTKCGMIEKRDYTAALGHDFQEIVIREASCDTPGKVLEICSRCGLAECKETDPCEHSFEISVSEPTCISPGYTVRECKVCGERHITQIEETLPHNYEEVKTEAGCTSGGFITHICKGCGSSFVTDYTEAKGHSWDQGHIVISPVCGHEGLKEFNCTVCGEKKQETIPSEEHEWDNGEIIVESKCEHEGVLQYTCGKCGQTRTEKIPARDHTEGEWIIDREPTSQEEGHRHTECTECGKILKEENIPKLSEEEMEKEASLHSAYIVGYPDGTFRYNSHLTRGETAAVFARLLAAHNGDTIGQTARTPYKDVNSHDWYAGYVNYLDRSGILTGYEDDTFRPNESITRSEFTAVAVRFYQICGESQVKKENTEKENFTDLPDSYWAAEFIRTAAEKGWINGYEDMTFRGEKDITRAEAVAVVNRLLEREADKDFLEKYHQNITIFSDMKDKSHWAYYDVIEATNSHYGNYEDGKEVWI